MKEKRVCKTIIGKINAYLDKEFPEGDMKLVAEHLIICNGCRLEYESLKRVNEQLNLCRTEPIPLALLEKLSGIPFNQKSQSRGFRQKFLPLPAAAAVLLTILSAVLLGTSYMANVNDRGENHDNLLIAQESLYNVWEEIAHE